MCVCVSGMKEGKEGGEKGRAKKGGEVCTVKNFYGKFTGSTTANLSL